MANHDDLIRRIMGVHSTAFVHEEDKIEFHYQNILDNVSLLDETLLEKINLLIAEAGYQLLKKKEEALRLKSDSYVVEATIHFPTDLNLLWSRLRRDT